MYIDHILHKHLNIPFQEIQPSEHAWFPQDHVSQDQPSDS